MLCIILGLALGIANIFHFNLLIIFSIILLYVSAHLTDAQVRQLTTFAVARP